MSSTTPRGKDRKVTPFPPKLLKTLRGLDLLASAPTAKTSQEAEPETRESQADKLLRLVLASGIELFHTPGGQAYATISVGTHKEHWALGSTAVKSWLRKLFFESENKVSRAQAVQDVLDVMEAVATFDGPQMPVYTRLAEAKNGNIYLDLADQEWRVVEVSRTGWRIVVDPSVVKFCRTRGMLALPVPEKGGSIEELRAFVNVPDEDSWRLLVAWLMMAFRPTGPYPILLLQGEQGSAKSTTARVLRALVDPSTAPLRTTPREERDLMIAANNAWLLAFDNLSGIPCWLSDALCRLATGGGFATRQLYTDDEEAIFHAMRPVVATGIDELTSRQDLLDRAIILNLPAIPEEKRQDETFFWRRFEEARPRILGALLDAVSAGLRNFDTVKLDRLPRMADFAKWVVACEEALPWKAGGFMQAYTGNREDAIELALEADPVSAAVRAMLAKRGAWEGTASELLPILSRYALESTRQTKAWPKSPKALSNQLRRAATFLRQVGVIIERFREPHTGNRLIRLRVTHPDPSSSPSSPRNPLSDAGCDDGDTRIQGFSSGIAGEIISDSARISEVQVLFAAARPEGSADSGTE